jgi:hypothetical protein
VFFELVGELSDVEIIAVGNSIRELRRLQKQYGLGRWRKLKGTGSIRLPDGTVVDAELHWYEAHGLGRCEMKIKRLLG